MRAQATRLIGGGVWSEWDRGDRSLRMNGPKKVDTANQRSQLNGRNRDVFLILRLAGEDREEETRGQERRRGGNGELRTVQCSCGLRLKSTLFR